MNFYSASEDGINAKEIRKLIKLMGGSRVVVHKLMLAPEINPEDKKAFTREVMNELGRDKGLDLQWYAVEHDNTEHHHVHVVLLGRDANGTEVRIDLKDVDKLKEYGERYLERYHPRELEIARNEREARERERLEQRQLDLEAARRERIDEGLELPWMHQKIVREMLEPYGQWRQKQDEQNREHEKREPERVRPGDTIEAAGKEWSKASHLEELRELHEYLWDNYEERIPKDDYKKLVGWIKEKEGQVDGGLNRKANPLEQGSEDGFDYKGEKFCKEDSYDKLTGLSFRLREAKERLPLDDYQKLRGWIENRDRERWAGVLEKQLELTHKRLERSKSMGDLKAAEGARVVDPQLELLVRNPIFGLFMIEASIASEIVRSIPLDDRNRDYAREKIEGLEEAKRSLDDREKKRKGKFAENKQSSAELKAQEERDRETRERIEKAQENTVQKRYEEQQQRRRDRDDRGRGDPFSRDEWGRW